MSGMEGIPAVHDREDVKALSMRRDQMMLVVRNRPFVSTPKGPAHETAATR